MTIDEKDKTEVGFNIGSVKDTKNYIRQIINQYGTDTVISKKHFDFMLNVLKKHPSAIEKIGCGVKNMWFENTIYGNKCFWLERVDGTKTDFSFLQCFTNLNPKADFLKACRKAIEPFIIDFRDGVFGNEETVFCPILNISITKHESHVDHYGISFIKIVRMFVELENVDFKKIKFIHEIGVTFNDLNLKNKWIDFHNSHAQLRVISAIANQKLPKDKW